MSPKQSLLLTCCKRFTKQLISLITLVRAKYFASISLNPYQKMKNVKSILSTTNTNTISSHSEKPSQISHPHIIPSVLIPSAGKVQTAIEPAAKRTKTTGHHLEKNLKNIGNLEKCWKGHNQAGLTQMSSWRSGKFCLMLLPISWVEAILQLPTRPGNRSASLTEGFGTMIYRWCKHYKTESVTRTAR